MVAVSAHRHYYHPQSRNHAIAMEVVDLAMGGVLGMEAGAMRWGMGLSFRSLRAAKAARVAVRAARAAEAADAAVGASRMAAGAAHVAPASAQSTSAATQSIRSVGRVEKAVSNIKQMVAKSTPKAAKQLQAEVKKLRAILDDVKQYGYSKVAEATGTDVETVKKSHELAKRVMKELKQLSKKGLKSGAEAELEHLHDDGEESFDYEQIFKQYNNTSGIFSRAYVNPAVPESQTILPPPHQVKNTLDDGVFHLNQHESGQIIIPTAFNLPEMPTAPVEVSDISFKEQVQVQVSMPPATQ